MGRFLKKSLKFTVCFAVLVLIYTIVVVKDIGSPVTAALKRLPTATSEHGVNIAHIDGPANDAHIAHIDGPANHAHNAHIDEPAKDANIAHIGGLVNEGLATKQSQIGPNATDLRHDLDAKPKNVTPNMKSEQQGKHTAKKSISLYNPKVDPQITNCTKDKMVVPNIIHWTWFYDEPHTVSWMAYISMLSVIRIQKPEVIYMWCTKSPIGQYWDEVLNEVNNSRTKLDIRHITPPKTVFNYTIEWAAHKSDIVRLQKLSELGGIYMDLDVIILKSFAPLMCHEFTLGRERNVKLNNGIVVSAKNATFIKHWFELYKKYDNKCWDCQSVHGANNLAKIYPQLLHIEQTTMNRPGYGERKYLYSPDLTFDWSNNYCVHTWYKAHNKEYNATSIKTLDLAIGELFRFIYYGSPDKVFN